VGTTVFSGDKLSTAESGSVQLRTGNARFLLAASSSATVSEDSGIPAARLLRGSATFSTANAKAFALTAATAVIRPKSDEATIGQVTILAEKQLLVKCTRGALTITVGDDSRVIPEGSAYRIVLEPANEEAQDQPPPQGAGTKGSAGAPRVAGSSKFVWYAVAAATLLTVWAVHEALESPDRP
jgi:ferric-dicitrate binding protein FerR (iron transport regulator)